MRLLSTLRETTIRLLDFWRYLPIPPAAITRRTAIGRCLLTRQGITIRPSERMHSAATLEEAVIRQVAITRFSLIALAIITSPSVRKRSATTLVGRTISPSDFTLDLISTLAITILISAALASRARPTRFASATQQPQRRTSAA